MKRIESYEKNRSVWGRRLGDPLRDRLGRVPRHRHLRLGPLPPRPRRVKTAPQLSMDGPKKLCKCLQFVCMARPAPRPRRVKTAPGGGAETSRAAHDARQDIADWRQDITDWRQDITDWRQDITDWRQDMTDWRNGRRLGGAPRRRQSVSQRLQISNHSLDCKFSIASRARILALSCGPERQDIAVSPCGARCAHPLLRTAASGSPRSRIASGTDPEEPGFRAGTRSRVVSGPVTSRPQCPGPPPRAPARAARDLAHQTRAGA